MKEKKTTSHTSLSLNCLKIYEAHHKIYRKYGEKHNEKEKGKLKNFEHNFQHMKVAGGLKVGLERNHHEQKKVCTSRS
jgi:hypothetical protein